MKIDVISIFPDYVDGPASLSLLGKARDEGLLDLRLWDLREWTTDRHRSVDDAPYGGGAGMVMRADVWIAACEEVWNTDRAGDVTYTAGGERPTTVLTTPRGAVFDQQQAQDFAALDRIVLLCGRYEGIDERVHELCATHELSVGDYVLFGGEVAALVVLEAVTRLLPGVVGNVDSPVDESFSDGLLEYPQYTRPLEIRGHTVPDVLRSGDHAAVDRWRRQQAIRLTEERRPDLEP